METLASNLSLEERIQVFLGKGKIFWEGTSDVRLREIWTLISPLWFDHKETSTGEGQEPGAGVRGSLKGN